MRMQAVDMRWRQVSGCRQELRMHNSNEQVNSDFFTVSALGVVMRHKFAGGLQGLLSYKFFASFTVVPIAAQASNTCFNIADSPSTDVR